MTRTLLADISAARGHVLPVAPVYRRTLIHSFPTTAIDYPFNLFTSGTIPKVLSVYLAAYHPRPSPAPPPAVA